MGFPAANVPCRIKTIRYIESCLWPFSNFVHSGMRYGLLLLAVGTQFTGHFKLRFGVGVT